jgi:hypothetical protein
MTAAGQFRVFVSAVSSEFETARDEIANDLGARGVEVKIMRDLRASLRANRGVAIAGRLLCCAGDGDSCFLGEAELWDLAPLPPA